MRGRNQNRRMAGKKGAVAQLQIEVNTEEDWQKLLAKEGLIVADVYSEWCGPCIGMIGILRKIKLEIGGDLLVLATVKSDAIEDLARFRGKSEPTWMFISYFNMFRNAYPGGMPRDRPRKDIIKGGRMANLMFGANAPRLGRMIIAELENEKRAQAGEKPRDTMPFDQLTPEEKEREEKKEKKRQEALAKEEAEKAAEAARLLEAKLSALERSLADYTLVALRPELFQDGRSEALEALLEALAPHRYRVEQEALVEADHPAILQFMATPGGPEPERQRDPEGEGEAGPEEAPPDTRVAVKLLRLERPGAGDEEAGEAPAEEERPDALELVRQAVHHELPLTELDVKLGVDQTGLLRRFCPAAPADAPCVWTPATARDKAAALLALFPELAEQHLPPQPRPVPPHVALMFDSTKMRAVTALVDDHRDDVLHVGFFSGPDPAASQRLASSLRRYERLPSKNPGDTLVVVLNRTHSEPLLSFCTQAPFYISPNVEDGARLREAFFPPGVEEAEEEDPAELEEGPEAGETGEEGLLIPEDHELDLLEGELSPEPSAE